MNEIQRHVAGIQTSAQTDPRFKQYSEVEVTPEAKDYTNRVFKSLLPHFPAWRQSCPEPDDLGRLKNAWTKAIMRHELKTGKKLNIRAGLLACEESDSDWLCSVGKFIKWCDQSGDLELTAQKALDLFNRGQRQIESVGQMVVSKHGFDLKRLNASESKKQFISLYLAYAQDNEIKGLDAFAVEDMSTYSYEERKRATERENRTDAENKALDDSARDEFFAKFNKFTELNPHIPAESVEKALEKHVGIKQGSLKKYNKSPAQLEEEKRRQLEMIKGMKQ